jgi:hypothetical protein
MFLKIAGGLQSPRRADHEAATPQVIRSEFVNLSFFHSG